MLGLFVSHHLADFLAEHTLDFVLHRFSAGFPLVELVLRIITGKPDLIITNCQTQKDMKRLGGARSICLDAYLPKSKPFHAFYHP